MFRNGSPVTSALSISFRSELEQPRQVLGIGFSRFFRFEYCSGNKKAPVAFMNNNTPRVWTKSPVPFLGRGKNDGPMGQ